MFTTTTPSTEAERNLGLIKEVASPETYTIPDNPSEYLYSDCEKNKGMIALCSCGMSTALVKKTVEVRRWCINTECQYARADKRHTALERVWLIEAAGCTVTEVIPGPAGKSKVTFTCVCGSGEYTMSWTAFQRYKWCTTQSCAYYGKTPKTITIPPGFAQTSVTRGSRTNDNRYHFTCPKNHSFSMMHQKALNGVSCTVCDRYASFSADYRAKGCELILTAEELADITNCATAIIPFQCPAGHVVDTLTKNAFSTRCRQNGNLCMHCATTTKRLQLTETRACLTIPMITDFKAGKILETCTALGVSFNNPPDRTPKGLRGVCTCGVPAVITYSAVFSDGNKWCSYTGCEFYRGDTQGQIALRNSAEARGCEIIEMIGTEAVSFTCACGVPITTSREASFCAQARKGWCTTDGCPNRGGLQWNLDDSSVAQIFVEGGWEPPFGHGSLPMTASRVYATRCGSGHIVTGSFMDFRRKTVVCSLCSAIETPTTPAPAAVVLPPPDMTVSAQWDGEDDYTAVIDHCRPTVDASDQRWVDHRGNGKNRYIELTDSEGNTYYEVEVICHGYGTLAMKISPESLPILTQNDRNWYVQKSKNKKVAYVRNGKRVGDNKTDYLFHQAVTGGVWDQVDHINHNGLDNRIENLRDGSGSINILNRRVYSTNTSGYECITRHPPNHKSNGRWVVNIRRKGQRPHKKTFSWSKYDGEEPALVAAVSYRDAYLQPTPPLENNPIETCTPAEEHVEDFDEKVVKAATEMTLEYTADTGKFPDARMLEEILREATKAVREELSSR